MVAARLNRPPLASVDPAALPAAPGKAGQGEHFLLERMVNRDGQDALTIHFGHLSQKVRAMVRTPLEDVVLPLVDHLVRESADELISAIGTACQQGFEERKRESDFTLRGSLRGTPAPGRARTGSTHEHADRRRQPSAPDECDGREGSTEIPCIEVGPQSGELFGSQRRSGAYGHSTVIPTLRRPRRPARAA